MNKYDLEDGEPVMTYSKGRKGITVDGVFIEWPFLVEALENAEEVEADRIQEAMEMCLEHITLGASYAILGHEIMNQVKKYISEVKAYREE